VADPFREIRQLASLKQSADRLRQVLRVAHQPEEPNGPCTEDLPIGEFIAEATPGYNTPDHLGALLDAIEQAEQPHTGRIFVASSVPPRHHKSETLKAAVVRRVRRDPTRPVAYCTHTQTFASKQNRSMRRLAKSLGTVFAGDSNRQDEWETPEGGGIVARGVGGELTGRGFPLIVVDDPIKSREQAESQVYRDKVWDWLCDDVISRLTPDGVIFLNHTRWHVDDPIGRALKDAARQWVHINIPALGGVDEDQPLLPGAGWTFAVLDQIRRSNAYSFASLYQGRPRPRGADVFRSPTYFDWAKAEPLRGYKAGYGVDLAYTAKTQADWSVCLRGKLYDGQLYLVDMQRKQVDAPSFTLTLKAKCAELRGKMRWYASGTEKGAAQFIRAKGIPLEVITASTDKLVRATPASESWNLGNILVPGGEDAPEWADILVDEVTGFTGQHDPHDDIVDALAALHDLLMPARRGSGRGYVANDSNHRTLA